MLEQFADHGGGSASVNERGAHNRAAQVVHDAYEIGDAGVFDGEVTFAPVLEMPLGAATSSAPARAVPGPRVRRLADIVARSAPAFMAGVAAAIVAPTHVVGPAFALFITLVVGVTTHLVARNAPPRGLLPFTAQVVLVVPAGVVGFLLAAAGYAGVMSDLNWTIVIAITMATALGAAVSALAQFVIDDVQKRVIVVGCALEADNLARELEGAGCRNVEVLGFIDVGAPGEWAPGRRLGALDELGPIVDEHSPDLLLLSSAAPRLDVFHALSESCLGTPVRVLELTAFYESTLGHVPIGAINDAWFQCMMHPNWSQTSRAARVCDLVIAATVGLIAAPLMLVLALLIRRDGGPVLYRQVRIGEGGRPFQMLKLRSMREEGEGPARWSSESDSRVTARRTLHPQDASGRDPADRQRPARRDEHRRAAARAAGVRRPSRADDPVLRPPPPDASRRDGLGADPLRLRRLGVGLGVEALARPLLPAAPLGGSRPDDPRARRSARCSRIASTRAPPERWRSWSLKSRRSAK